MKPGWQSSEFWLAVGTKLIALCVTIGVFTSGQGEDLTAHLSNAITGLFAILALVSLCKSYISSRTDLKQRLILDRPGTPPPESALLPKALALIVAALFLTASPANAQTQTALLPWRDRIEKQLQNGNQQNQAYQQLASQVLAQQHQLILAMLQQRQQQPQIIYFGPVPQTLPIGGPPLQQLPISGPPLQQLPIAGPPLQQLPIQGAPQQQLPIQGPPLQQLPPQGTPPQQQPPIAGPPLQQLGPAPLSPPAVPAPAPMPAPPPGINGRPQQQLPVAQPQRYTPATWPVVLR
jgi:hypothetical protein